MLTRCPHCQTAFRITHEQLIPRQGRVRCGACYLVFSALDSLSDEPTGAALPVTEVLPEQEEVVPVAVVVAEEAPPAPDPVPNSWPFPWPERVAEPEPAPEPEPIPELEPKTVEPESVPDAWTESEAEAAPRRWPWATGMVLLLLLGAGQLIYLFRIELVVLMPELRPPLTASCAALGCEVPYPHRPELMAIESSDLAPADNERLHLTANLRNRAPFAQAYPHLELTLTDTADAPMLRKVLAPADYLPAEKSTAFFAPRDEVAVSLHFETPGLSPVGYRLYLFYP
jgi:predicted Zn finger-like uncharacterized protein